jgi:hypothetical protein
MEEIALLLHLLHNTPERLIALSRLAQSFPPFEAATIWPGWETHFANALETFPDGKLAHDAILRILVAPITSLGKTSEISELLRLFGTNMISEASLTAHTAVKPPKEQMAQSSKRVREDADEDARREEDTGKSALLP